MRSRIVSRKLFVDSVYEQLIRRTTNGSESYDFDLYTDSSLAMMHMLYIAERFFTEGDQTPEEIAKLVDVEYLKPLIEQRHTHIDTVIAAINENSTTFTLSKMDPIDQAILLCGGVEYLVHKTPHKIMINEMIEIAKKYGDEGSPKVINGIGHNMLESLKSH